MNIKMLRTVIIEKLEEQLPVAEADDRQKLAAHYSQNAARAADRRKTITANLAALDDDKLAETGAWQLKDVLVRGLGDAMTCPRSRKRDIEQQLKMLRLDGRKTITLTDGDYITQLMSPPTDTPATLC